MRKLRATCVRDPAYRGPPRALGRREDAIAAIASSLSSVEGLATRSNLADDNVPHQVRFRLVPTRVGLPRAVP